MEKSSWQRTKESFGYRCAYCLKKIDHLTRDHLVSRSKGGITVPENIVPACEECNQAKGNGQIWEMLMENKLG